MTPTILSLAVMLLVPAQPGNPDAKQRKPNPLAPSLPLLTAEEEDKLDRIIDRFILFDLGQLPGEDGKRALADFKNLGPEAFFALVRGINKAATIEGSCPAATIAKKLGSVLRGSNDLDLLDFARENIGAGLGNNHRLLHQTEEEISDFEYLEVIALKHCLGTQEIEVTGER